MNPEELDRISLELDSFGESLNFKQLYYFHTVAAEGTIVRAAKKVGVASGTISEQVKKLETYLQVQLFDRTSGMLRLNSNGRRIFDHTTVMFRAARRLMQDFHPDRMGERFVLELGLCPTISRTFTTERFLPLFTISGMIPRIRNGDYDYLLRGLLAGDYDIILSENRPAGIDERRIGVRALHESPLVCVAGPELAQRIEKYPEGLANVPFMHYPHASRYHMEIDSFMLGQGIDVTVMAEADDIALMITAARKDLCAVAVPETAVRESLAKGELVKLGEIATAKSVVYAQYQQMNMPELVQRSLDALTGEMLPTTTPT